MISCGMGSQPVPTGKFLRERSVWAPQYLSAGTATRPGLSFPMRSSKILPPRLTDYTLISASALPAPAKRGRTFARKRVTCSAERPV